jgi:hypothetical protein
VLISIKVIGSRSFGVGAAVNPSPLSVVVGAAVDRSINVIGARPSLDPVVVITSLGSVINVIGARSSLDVAVALASVVVTLGNVPLEVGKLVTVTVRVVVTVMVWVRESWGQDFVPQCALRG